MLVSIVFGENKHVQFSYEPPDRQGAFLQLRDNTEVPLQGHYAGNNNPPYEYRRFETFVSLQALFSHLDRDSSGIELIHPKSLTIMRNQYEKNKM